jgi:glycosyltransferase involved in cell wall biosynthesis
MVAQRPFEVIVVDYGCPDRTGDWVEANFPEVKVVRVDDDPDFCSPRARNLGARQASADWLVLIDGDVRAGEGWSAWMQQNLQPGHFYRAARLASGKLDPETVGTVICTRADFDAIDGYDEAFRGWAADDVDFYQRLNRHGVVEQTYPSRFVTAISHGDQERAGFDGLQDQAQKDIVDNCYMAAKAQMARTYGRDGKLPLKVRQDLLAYTRRTLGKWFDEGASRPVTIRYQLRRTRPVRQRDAKLMETELTFTITVRPAPAPDPLEDPQ